MCALFKEVWQQLPGQGGQLLGQEGEGHAQPLLQVLCSMMQVLREAAVPPLVLGCAGAARHLRWPARDRSFQEQHVWQTSLCSEATFLVIHCMTSF